MNGPLDAAGLERIPALPAALIELARAVCSPKADLNEVAQAVEADPTVAAKVIRFASAASSSGPVRMRTVMQAVIRLGPTRVIETLVAETLMPLLLAPCEAYLLGGGEGWRHAVAASILADMLANVATTPVPRIASTAALLHDVGKVVLSQRLEPGVVQGIRDLAARDRLTHVDAERSVLGTDHAQVGAAIARHWGLPELAAKAIERHHDPDGDPDPVLDTVHMANVMAKLIAAGLGADELNLKASRDAPQRLGIDHEDVEALAARALDELPYAILMYVRLADAG